MASLTRVPRADKLDVTIKLRKKFVERAEKRELAGLPADLAYDAFIPELDAMIAVLSVNVTGVQTADEVRVKRLTDADQADDWVDTYYRRIEAFIRIEARRRHGANVARAQALYALIFADGLAHVDEPPREENPFCRTALGALRSTDWSPLVIAIELPDTWLDRWAKALDTSDSLITEIADARTKRKGHVGVGQGAELDWVEMIPRLRGFIISRAKRTDAAQVAEARDLIAPLTDTLTRIDAEEARRATLREQEAEKKKAEAAKKPAAPAAPTEMPAAKVAAAPATEAPPAPAAETPPPADGTPKPV
jgi:hypothetical protein